MSSMTLAGALARIKSALPNSPIAIFRSPHAGHVECVFANTLRTKTQIECGDPDFVGVFDCGVNLDVVRALLGPIIRGDE